MKKEFKLSKAEIMERLGKLEKKIRATKRRKSFIKTGLLIIIPASLGGLIFGFSMSENIEQAFRIFLFSGIVAGIMFFLAGFEKIISHYRLRRLPFLWHLFIKVLMHTILLSTVFIAFYYFQYGDFLLTRAHGTLFLKLLLLSSILGIIINLILISNRMIGKGVLLKYLTGRYHTPIEEERIFMFIDIKSSTTIAEKIGHRKFHSLLNDFFYDITDPILENDGEIYKYVGDEVIVTWPLKKGIKNNNCVRAFFEVKKKIEEKKDRYLKDYGLVPEFKAGLHCGTIIVGEMGDIKSEIAYLGDVVNTTARIQTQCHVHDADLLTSSVMIEKMEEPLFFGYSELGEIQLRGKKLSTMLVKIEM